MQLNNLWGKKMKNKVLFWIIQLTWNLLENILGLFVFLFLIIIGKKPKKYHRCVRFEIGENYGGFNVAWCIVTHKNPSDYLLKHEHGHFIQALIFGPFEILIQLISIIRYWYRVLIVKLHIKKEYELPGYYSIWFEKQASDLGYKYIDAKF